eukprot:Hpha_TRINITY_DN9609_c0_g2::TRINITY_DN9609_c0_g2_i1::g.184401::m.184401
MPAPVVQPHSDAPLFRVPNGQSGGGDGVGDAGALPHACWVVNRITSHGRRHGRWLLVCPKALHLCNSEGVPETSGQVADLRGVKASKAGEEVEVELSFAAGPRWVLRLCTGDARNAPGLAVEGANPAVTVA